MGKFVSEIVHRDISMTSMAATPAEKRNNNNNNNNNNHNHNHNHNNNDEDDEWKLTKNILILKEKSCFPPQKKTKMQKKSIAESANTHTLTHTHTHTHTHTCLQRLNSIFCSPIEKTPPSWAFKMALEIL